MKKEFVNKFSTVITGAFSLVAALAWNETIKTFINLYIPKGSEVLSLFIYALIVTIIAVFVSYYVSRVANKVIKTEEKLEKKVQKLEDELEKHTFQNKNK